MLTVVLTSKGDVFTLGDNIDGQLGTSSPIHVVPKKVGLPYKTEYIDCGLNHVIALSKYKIFAWGCNRRGQIHPKSLLPFFETPLELEWITNSLPLAIHCGPQQTFLISKEAIILPDRPVIDVDNTGVLRKEIDAYKNKLVLLKKENEKLKEEVKNILNNINTIGKEGIEAVNRKGVDSNEEIMNKFKSELKVSRTLRPVFEIDLKEIKILTKISEGAFGIIYKAKWREITVAIKTLKQEYMKDDTIKDFLSELTR
jgi:mitogen-activated protein kinase kinase kinase 9